MFYITKDKIREKRIDNNRVQDNHYKDSTNRIDHSSQEAVHKQPKFTLLG